MVNRLGSFIKLTRQKQDLTQDDLSVGICASSYLSRIENDKVVAVDNIYHMLLHKLGLKYENIKNPDKEVEVEIENELENWYLHMLRRKNDPTEMNKMKQLIKSAGHENSITFEIMNCRHLLMNGELEQAGEMLHHIGSILTDKRGRSYFIYTNILMVYYHLKNHFAEALALGLDVIEIDGYKSFAKDYYEIALFHYNIALNYSRLHQYKKCIQFSRLALNVFNDNYDVDRSLDCQLLLGIAYNNLRNWKQSIQAYDRSRKILKNFSIESEDHYYRSIYNNLGYCYEGQNEYNKSIRYYEMSLEYESDLNNRLRTLINLVRCNHTCGKKEKAIFWLQLGIDLKDKEIKREYIHQLDIYTLILQDTDTTIEDIIKLQTTSIKYFSENKMWVFVLDYTNLFAHLYEKQAHYKKANEMYKLSLEAMKKIEENHF